MKRLMMIVALLPAGCAPGKAPEPDRPENPADLRLVMLDLASLKLGQHATYNLTRQGEPRPEYLKYAVVAGELDGTLWLETTFPHENGQMMIAKARVDNQGRTHEMWIGTRGSKAPQRTYPREDGQGPSPAPFVATPRLDVTEEEIGAAGRTWRCTKVTVHTLGDPIVNWCHPDVPFRIRVGERTFDGLVKRVHGKNTMELLSSSQQGARAELELPTRK